MRKQVEESTAAESARGLRLRHGPRLELPG